MADSVPDWPADLPRRLHGALSRIAGGLPANIGVMQLLVDCAEHGQAEEVLQSAARHLGQRGEGVGQRRLLDALDLLRHNPQAFGVVRSVLSGLDHQRSPASESEELAYWAASFDGAARKSPEGSVALYSLGNASLLHAATDEIVGRLRDWGLVSRRTECLDIGCGIGRFELALGAAVARIVGIDISAEMVEAARKRCGGLANVEFRHISGRDLSGFGDESFGLVLAVDAFPYMVQAGSGLAQRMLAECARVLHPGGQLVILNFSYRGDLERDRRDLIQFAEAHALKIVRDGTSEFELWDGVAFQLGKP